MRSNCCRIAGCPTKMLRVSASPAVRSELSSRCSSVTKLFTAICGAERLRPPSKGTGSTSRIVPPEVPIRFEPGPKEYA
jgi:hypothetical protein